MALREQLEEALECRVLRKTELQQTTVPVN